MIEAELPITGKVADILDKYTLVINRGSEQHVRAGMIFAVMGQGGQIIDPETKTPLGPRPVEKLRVKVTDVYDRYCVAETYRIVTPRSFGDLIGGPSIRDWVGGLQQPLSEAQTPQRERFAGISDSPDQAPTNPVVGVEVGDSVRQLLR